MESATPPGTRRLFPTVPRRVRSLVLLLSFITVGVGYLGVLIAAYLPELGVPSDAVGLILGASGIAMVVSAIPLGLLSDRIERKRLLIPAGVAFPLCLLVYAVTTDVAALVLAGILAGVAEAAFLSSWNALIADMTTAENRNDVFSLSFVVSTLCMGVGLAIPFAFPAIVQATGWSSHDVHVGAMAAVALLSFVSPVGLALLLRDYHERPHASKAAGPRGDLRPLLKFSGLNGLIGLGAGFIIPLIPTWLFLKFGVPDTYSGPLLAVANLTIGLAAFASTRLARRYGQVRAIVLMQGVSTVFMLSLVAVPTALLAGAVYVVRAGLMNMSSPLMDSFLMGIVRPEQRGLASAVNSLVWRLPNSITTVFGGVILASGDYALPFLLATLFYAIGISGFYAVFRRTKPAS